MSLQFKVYSFQCANRCECVSQLKTVNLKLQTEKK